MLKGTRRKRAIPRGVWALGLVSLFMDISSELIHALLPIFLVTVIGASTVTVGLIEGVAEATAAITKIFSGTLSDYLKKRKILAVLGYGMAAATKPLFPLADSAATVFTARFLDRVGKGIRGAPRDALVSDLTPSRIRGAAYGLRQSLDTIGAAAGPLLAMALMIWLSDDIRAVFWVAVIPASISVLILLVWVHEPPTPLTTERAQPPFRAGDILRLPREFWAVVAVGLALTLARFSEAFLLLRAADVGLALRWVPLVMVIMNLAYAVSSYPAGVLSDRWPRRHILAGGLVCLLGADLLLAAGGVAGLMGGVVLWGLHMGATQGLLAALVADTSPPTLRGSAFGVFNMVAGLALLAASSIAGVLWHVVGPAATFFAGAGFTVLALIALALLRVGSKPASSRGA